MLLIAACTLRHLRSVAKLISSIISHNHTYKFDTNDAAFNDHRLLTVDPDERQRRRKQRRLALVEERDSLRAQLQQQQPQVQQVHELPSPPPPSARRPLPPSPTPQRSEQAPQGDGPVSSTSVSSPLFEPALPSAGSSSTTDRDRVQHLEGVVAQLSQQLTQSSHRDALQVQRQQEYMDGLMMQLLAHKVKPAQLRSSLDQQWIELVLILLNR